MSPTPIPSAPVPFGPPHTAPARQPGTVSLRMDRVLTALDRVLNPEDPDAIHDLRVALRRCRAVATAMIELDPHRDWRTLRRQSRTLFRALGAVRDLQILEQWIEKLTAVEDPGRQQFLDRL